jgi:hypothetical protein
MAKTWPIECDMRTLQVLEFCMQQMVGALQDEIDDGSKGLRSDLKITKALLAQACKGQVNLAVKKSIAKKGR